MARKYFEIIINRKYRLDVIIAEDAPVLISQILVAANDVTERGSLFSQNITIPGTKNNQRIVGHIYPGSIPEALNVTASGNSHIPDHFTNPVFECEIICDGIPLFRGKATFGKSTFRKNPESYDLVLYADNGDWLFETRNKKLRELNNFSDTIDYTLAAMLSANTDFFTDDTKSVFWPMINYGRWGHFASYHGIHSDEDLVSPFDYRPAIRIKHILENIFRAQGYRLVSDFCEGEFFKRLILPFHIGYNWAWKERPLKKYLHVTKTVNQLMDDPVNIILFEDDSTGVNFDVGNLWSDPSDDVWGGAPLTGYYKFRITFTCDNHCVYFPQDAAPDQIPTEIFNREPAPGGGVPAYYITPGTHVIDGRIFLRKGDSFNITFGPDYETNPTSPADMFTIMAGATLEIEIDDQVFFEHTGVGINTVLSEEHTQLEFVQGLIHMFGLIVKTDNYARIVYIEPFQQVTILGETHPGFYDAHADREDWSSKRNLLKDGTLTKFDNPKRHIINFKSDGGDKLVLELQDKLKQTLYSAGYQFKDNLFTDAEVIKVNPFFAATHHIQDKRLLNNTYAIYSGNPQRQAPYIPRIWDGVPSAEDAVGSIYPDPTYKSEPRILFAMYDVGNNLQSDNDDPDIPKMAYPFNDADGGPGIIDGGSASLKVGVHGCAFQVNYLNEIDNEGSVFPNLSFADEVSGVNELQLQHGLFRKFWLHLFAMRRSGYLLTQEFYLKDSEAHSLDFRTLKYVGDNLYLLMSFHDHNPVSQGTTKCLMMMWRAMEVTDFRNMIPFKYLNPSTTILEAADEDLANSNYINGLRTLEKY